jgi:hypothetical protein
VSPGAWTSTECKSRGSYRLRWTDVDFEAQTISIEITRVVVDCEVVEGGTKSET